MGKSKQTLLKWLLVPVIVAFAIYGYHNYRRGAVARYFNNQQFAAFLDILPKSIESEQRVLINLDGQHVILHVDVHTQQEFDQVMRASQRSGRPRVERIIVTWKGIVYQV